MALNICLRLLLHKPRFVRLPRGTLDTHKNVNVKSEFMRYENDYDLSIMIYHHGVRVVTGYIHSIRLWDFHFASTVQPGAAQPHTVCQGASGIEMPQHHMQRCHVSRQAKGEALRRTPRGRPWTPSRRWLHRQHHRLELMDLLARLRRPRLLWCSCWCCW